MEADETLFIIRLIVEALSRILSNRVIHGTELFMRAARSTAPCNDARGHRDYAWSEALNTMPLIISCIDYHKCSGGVHVHPI